MTGKVYNNARNRGEENLKENLRRENKMTREELKARIEKIKDELFMINMIDHWSRRDEEEYNSLRKELESLREKLKTAE